MENTYINNNEPKKGNENKKQKGQFYTTSNPFNINIFFEWFNIIPEEKRTSILEPFAGANNIVKMITELKIKSSWSCYDIEPSKNNVVPEIKINQRDTIANYPSGYSVCITNPPYLAKNSAARNHLSFPECKYDDLYKLCLDIILNNSEYVAVIIPESFINANLFQDRLFAFISLTQKMFQDTECPVCIALFVPREIKATLSLEENDFYIYDKNINKGKYNQLKTKIPNPTQNISWTFNDKKGIIGIKCIDDTISPSIEFVNGNLIDENKIKVSSRSLTRISGLPEDIPLDEFIIECNKILIKFREDTSDVFLTSFKGLRSDGKYRRRLDFANAKKIMNLAIENIRKEKNNDKINN